MEQIKKPIKRRIPEDKLTLSEHKKRRPFGKGRIFWFVWLALALAVTGAWIYLLNRVDIWLGEYEDSQPKYVAQRVYTEHFADKNYLQLLWDGNIVISEFEDAEAVAAYAASLFGDAEWQCIQSYSADPDVLKYSVSADSTAVGSFTLVPSTCGTGSEAYMLDTITFNVYPTRGANIYAPAGAVVKVNGVALGDSYKYGDSVVLADAVYYPEGDESARTMQNYYVGGLFNEPTVTVTSADGSIEYALDYDPETVVWRADTDYINRYVTLYNEKIAEEERRKQEEAERLLLEGEAIKAELGEYTLTAVQTYARWMQDDARTAERNKYFDQKSEFFNSIGKLVSQSYIMWHKGYYFDDIVNENYRWLDEEKTDYAAHVSFTQVLTECTDPYGDKDYPEWKNRVDVTVYMHLVEGNWLIYDIRNDAVTEG